MTGDGPIADCCIPAPAVMKFDKEGNLLDAWGGPADEGYFGSDQCREEDGAWPAGEHGIFVDHNDFVYIAGNGSGSGAFPWDADHGDDARAQVHCRRHARAHGRRTRADRGRGP